MADAVITEYAGTRKNDTITRFYQYGNGGVRVLDGNKKLRRVYRFDAASDMMTEHDPVRSDRILRRFIFDRMGMLEETFAPGCRPRKFSYEQEGRCITVREGGEYGQVGKTFTFDGKGIAESAWGRNGEIERVFVFEAGNESITERSGSWFGDVIRTILFEGINASLFREPEAFLQFLMFSEWSEQEKTERIDEQVASIRGGTASSRRNPYISAGKRPASAKPGTTSGQVPARSSRGSVGGEGIDFIADSDAPAEEARGLPLRRSDAISFDERLNREGTGNLSAGRSAQIPLQERFESSRREREPLSKGRSVEIPLQERFDAAHQEQGPLSMGKSVEIPLDERFENARREREQLKKGRSADIPYSERRGDRD
ncbi:MAG: hypothetical protein M0Q92_05440 [Methanoregula sp.]|jgi:hypothetical protein|nr:hypothetical protein [Methanoregula sp.]